MTRYSDGIAILNHLGFNENSKTEELETIKAMRALWNTGINTSGNFPIEATREIYCITLPQRISKNQLESLEKETRMSKKEKERKRKTIEKQCELLTVYRLIEFNERMERVELKEKIQYSRDITRTLHSLPKHTFYIGVGKTRPVIKDKGATLKTINLSLIHEIVYSHKLMEQFD